MKNKVFYFLAFFLFVVFIGFKYTQNNLDVIYSNVGNYYFKKNNISKAQEYYEKAFELGLEDSKQRNIYINSIINSPLTTEAQEKLVKFLKNSKDDSAKYKAEFFLSDLKREIHRKYPYNYITNTVFNQKVIRWGELPITYTFKNKENVPAYFIQEFENAFTEWEKATEHSVLFQETNKDSNITIIFESHNPADNDGQKYIVAYTTPILKPDQLTNMEIVFYLKDSNDEYFSQNQVYNTALHEIAHALGFMGHSREKDDVMYLSKDTKDIVNDTREILSQADINTLKLLYKIKPQITNVKNVDADYIPYLVLGTEKQVNNEKIREAKNYIRKASNLPTGYIDLAEGYVIAKDYSKAIKCLEKALRLADTEEIKAMIYYNLAVTNFYVDSLTEAKQYLQLSMNIKDSEEKHYLLGEIYIREGQTDKAINEYTKLIRQNPKNAEYVVSLANIYVVNRDYIKARKVLKTFFNNNPSEKNNPRFEPYGILKIGL